MKPGDALIAALRARDVLHGADARLVTWLRDRLLRARRSGANHHKDDAGAGDVATLETFTLVAAALCRACASGSLCLPLAGDALSAALMETLRDAQEEETRRDAQEDLPGAAGALGTLDAANAVLGAGAARPGVTLLPGTPGTSGADSEAARAAAARFLAAPGVLDDGRDGVFADVIGTAAVPRPLVRAHGNLYLHRYWFAARGIAEALTARAVLPPPAAPHVREAILRETLVDNPLRTSHGAPLELMTGQRDALVAALSSSVFVLGGGPGTGKTTWTAAWLRAVLRIPGVDATRVRLCAPTGRAAQRLAESLRGTLAGNLDDPRDAAAAALPVTTLHTMLGWRAFEGRFARSPEDPLDAEWVLLDEASMADVFLLSALVRALRPGARLVLAGDPGQLPAVEAGAVLGELLPEREGAPGPVPSMTLDVSHRATGEVIPLAAAVRRGDEDKVIQLLGPAYHASAPAEAFDATRTSTLARIEPGEDAAAGMRTVLYAFAARAFAVAPRTSDGSHTGHPPEHVQTSGTGGYTALLNRFRAATRDEETSVLGALWKLAARARVLAPLRRGPVSTERANRTLRERLEPEWRHARDARGAGFHGAPVLVTRNDARTGLSNGELGLWLESGDGATVYFPRPEHADGWLRIPAALLPECELGFATTVHKSQGSECDEVLILLPEAGNRLLARETLYTAITRARTAIRVYGSEHAVREATGRTLRRPGGVRELFPDSQG